MVDFSRDWGFLNGIFMILGLMKNDEKFDFIGFARSEYRSDFVKIKSICK